MRQILEQKRYIFLSLHSVFLDDISLDFALLRNIFGSGDQTLDPSPLAAVLKAIRGQISHVTIDK